MDCKFDSTGLCIVHGIQMHIDFAEMDGSCCPVGHIAEVERRFDHVSKEVLEMLRRQGLVTSDLIERIEAIEDKLGIVRPSLFWGDDAKEDGA